MGDRQLKAGDRVWIASDAVPAEDAEFVLDRTFRDSVDRFVVPIDRRPIETRIVEGRDLYLAIVAEPVATYLTVGDGVKIRIPWEDKVTHKLSDTGVFTVLRADVITDDEIPRS